MLRPASSEMVRVRFCRTLSQFDVLTIYIACDYFIGKADRVRTRQQWVALDWMVAFSSQTASPAKFKGASLK